MPADEIPFAFYGTLRPGGGALRRLGLPSDAMRHLGGCLIPGRLIVPAWYPALVTGEGGVVGDLFDVPDDLIPMLDEFEGAHDTPDGLYVRTRQTLIEPAITAWVYLWNGDPGAGPEVPTGDWNDWTMDL